jgi:hypothetical protein
VSSDNHQSQSNSKSRDIHLSQSELTAIPVTSRISLSFKNKSNKGAATSATSCTSPAGSCGGGGDGHHASGSRTTAMAVNGGTLESIVALESADPTAATTATASDVTTSLTVPVDGEEDFSFSYFLFFLFDFDEWPTKKRRDFDRKPNKPASRPSPSLSSRQYSQIIDRSLSSLSCKSWPSSPLLEKSVRPS